MNGPGLTRRLRAVRRTDPRRRHMRGAIAFVFVALAIGLGGCSPAPAPMPVAPPPSVLASHPVQREVTDYSDFTGRLAAVEYVELRARVSGYLDALNFKEGALVEKGDVLIEIDPRMYEASLRQAEANVASAEARLKRLNADLKRAEYLIGKQAIAQEEFDKIAGDRNEATASLEAAQAAVERTQLDLTFTKVTAPVSGRVGRAQVTVGNLVQSGEQGGGTLLTTLVSVDPIYAYFDVDERTVQYVRRLIREGKAKSARDAKLTIQMGLATETGHPYEGVIDFVDNKVDPTTGTLRVRGVFANPEEALSPGFFTRIRVPIGFPHQALLITDRAVDNDQGQKIVYVLDDDDEVLVRPVELGALHDGLRVVTSGIQPTDRVVVSGLLQIRTGMKVEAKLVEMPNFAPRTANPGDTDTKQPQPSSEN